MGAQPRVNTQHLKPLPCIWVGPWLQRQQEPLLWTGRHFSTRTSPGRSFPLHFGDEAVPGPAQVTLLGSSCPGWGLGMGQGAVELARVVMEHGGSAAWRPCQLFPRRASNAGPDRGSRRARSSATHAAKCLLRGHSVRCLSCPSFQPGPGLKAWDVVRTQPDPEQDRERDWASGPTGRPCCLCPCAPDLAPVLWGPQAQRHR